MEGARQPAILVKFRGKGLKISTGNDAQRKDEDPFVSRVFLAVGIIMGTLIVAAILWYTQEIVFLLFAGILVAIFFRRTSLWMSQRSGFHVQLCLVFMVLALGGFIFIVVFFLGPSIADQMSKLFSELPSAIQKFHAMMAHSPLGRIFFAEIAGVGKLGSNAASIASGAAGFFFTTVGVTISIFAVLVFGLYMAVSPDLYLKGIVQFISPKNRLGARKVIDAIGDALQWWLIGQALDMVSVGLMVLIGLWLLKIPLAMTLGLLAGLLDFVPLVGAIVSAIPAILIALAVSPYKALYVAILFLGVHLFEGYVLGPLIQQRTVLVPPLVMLVAIVFMGLLAGFLGIILAGPLVVSVMVLVQMLMLDGAE